jgi:hypothetical protein
VIAKNKQLKKFLRKFKFPRHLPPHLAKKAGGGEEEGEDIMRVRHPQSSS